MIIWTIGFLFTWGLTIDDRIELWQVIILIFVWPILLGRMVRKWMEEIKTEIRKQREKDENNDI